MDERWVNGETFCKETNSTVVVSESDEADTAVSPGSADPAEIEVAQPLGLPALRVNTVGWSLPQFGVSMVLVMELLKAVRFLAKMNQGREPLPTEEALVVGVIETLDDAVAPRFSFWYKDDLDPCVETETNHQAETPRVSV